MDALNAATVQVPALGGGDGVRFDVARNGNELRFTRSGGEGSWSIVLPAGIAVSGSSGGEPGTNPRAGTGFMLRSEADTVTITLSKSTGPLPSLEETHR